MTEHVDLFTQSWLEWRSSTRFFLNLLLKLANGTPENSLDGHPTVWIFLRWISRGHCVWRKPCTLQCQLFLYFPAAKSWIRSLHKDKIISPLAFALLFKTIYAAVYCIFSVQSKPFAIKFLFADQQKRPFPWGCWSVFAHLKRFF